MKRFPAWRAIPGVALMAALALAGAGTAAGNAGTPLNYIVPVAAGSVEDPAARPLMPPNLTIADGTNMPLPLEHFRGAVLLVNFWATWCAPCIKEMVFLDRLQGDFKGMPLEILPVSEDKGGLKVAKGFMDRQKLTFLRTFTDPGAAAAQVLHVTGLPTSFIVDKHGRLVQRVEGPYEWDSPAIKARFLELLKEGS
jgi:thiol-disulfide isomerase/thioredoxin